jgi:hypothetical protein
VVISPARARNSLSVAGAVDVHQRNAKLRNRLVTIRPRTPAAHRDEPRDRWGRTFTTTVDFRNYGTISLPTQVPACLFALVAGASQVSQCGTQLIA